METEAEFYRLRHERNVWRGIAIGLGATLGLLLVLAGIGGFLFTVRSQEQRARADAAMMEAERARMEADEAARKNRALVK